MGLGHHTRVTDTAASRTAEALEHLLVLDGVVRLEASNERETLHAGDTAAFPGDQPHCYAAATGSDLPARFALSVFQPGVGVTALPDR